MLEWSSENNLKKSVVSFYPVCKLGIKLRLKAWQQALLPTEQSHQPQVTVGCQFKTTINHQDSGLPICPLGQTQYSDFCLCVM